MTCSVHGCSKRAVAKGLCDTHRKRLARHGSVEQTRPNDWGTREKHPLYKSWNWLRRNQKPYSTEWSNFWQFVQDVGERPSENHKLFRQDETLPYSKDNFYWREVLIKINPDVEKKQKAAAWMREYRKLHPERFRNAELKKKYGITLEQYDQMLELQKGVCAICSKPEIQKSRNGEVQGLSVDHCHRTGKVRQLLCAGCNTGIGSLRNDPEILQAAINYLLKHKEN